MLKIHPVSSDFMVTITASRPVPAMNILQEVDEIWANEAQLRTSPPFNGSLISISTLASDRLTGWIGDYKWFVAQRRHPSLFSVLKTRPLAVSGVLLCRDGLVFGRRTADVEMNAGLWELVPSGSVPAPATGSESINLVSHLLTELEEELSLCRAAIPEPPEAFVLVDDDDSHVVDVGYIMRTPLSRTQVLSAFEGNAKHEYAALEIVTTDSLNQFIRQSTTAILPVSRVLIDAARKSGRLA